jgi:general secretion pathway protein A
MYSGFFGFEKEPFHITPDPEFLYLSPSHKEALGVLVSGVERRLGFIAIIGDVGLGKTTILHSYLEQRHDFNITAIVIFNPRLSFEDLLKVIFADLELDSRGLDVRELQEKLHQFLIEEYGAGRNVVLIIDEAQNLPLDTLEQLRMLSNLETGKDKLLQIILAGQTELEELLSRPELRQIEQRIAVRAKLAPLTRKESLDYIRFRLSKVSPKPGARVFTRMAMRSIVKYSGGIPRKINIICDNALITALGYQRMPVTRRMVKEVIKDFEEIEPKGATIGLSWKIWISVSALVLLAMIGLQLSPYRDLLPEEVHRLYSFLQHSIGYQPREQSPKPAATVPSSSPQPAPDSNHQHRESSPKTAATDLPPSPQPQAKTIELPVLPAALSSAPPAPPAPEKSAATAETQAASSGPQPGGPVSGQSPVEPGPAVPGEGAKIDAAPADKAVQVEAPATVEPQIKPPAPEVQQAQAKPSSESAPAPAVEPAPEKVKQGGTAAEQPDPARIIDRVLKERAGRKK